MRQAHTVKPLHIFGLATQIGFLSGSIAYQAIFFFSEKRQPFILPLGMNLSYWYAWGLLVPLILWLARRFPFERGVWPRSLAVHLVAVFVVTFVHVALTEAASVPLMRAVLGESKMSWWSRVQHVYVMNIDWEMVGYWAIVGLSHAMAFYREAQDRALRASQLETRLAEAQLQALQRQLHPHFLFNTLNAISALMHRDVDAADQMLTRLSDLLRMALDQPGVQEIALKDELDFLAKYLEIEQARFGDRLTVRFDVDPLTLDAQVPNLVLQPLVENSIRHAIAVRIEPGVIEIRARRAGGQLLLEVCDNGPGLAGLSRAASGRGVGLANTRSRLEHLYGDAQQLSFSQPTGGGLVVTVAIPFRSDEPLDALDEAAPEDVKGVA
jgi:signal transduction histidine kinase